MLAATNSAIKTKRDAKVATKPAAGVAYEESKDTVMDVAVDVAAATQGKFPDSMLSNFQSSGTLEAPRTLCLNC